MKVSLGAHTVQFFHRPVAPSLPTPCHAALLTSCSQAPCAVALPSSAPRHTRTLLVRHLYPCPSLAAASAFPHTLFLPRPHARCLSPIPHLRQRLHATYSTLCQNPAPHPSSANHLSFSAPPISFSTPLPPLCPCPLPSFLPLPLTLTLVEPWMSLVAMSRLFHLSALEDDAAAGSAYLAAIAWQGQQTKGAVVCFAVLVGHRRGALISSNQTTQLLNPEPCWLLKSHPATTPESQPT